ncbi:hypothetical protein AMTRI_Chr08g167390 [Amborella trichopoda]
MAQEKEESRKKNLSSAKSKKRKRPVKILLTHISDDIILCILSSLPTESICRFKCVCKSWQRLLSSQEFTQFHSLSLKLPSDTFALASNGQGFIFLQNSKNFTQNYSNLAPPLTLSVSGHLNHFVCSNGIVSYTIIKNPNIYVCNPVTKQHLTFPFHHFCHPTILGFYFNPVILPQKGERFTMFVSATEFSMLSSATGHWKQIAASQDIMCWKQPAICVDGICYQVFNECPNMVSAFDMEKENWEHIPLPVMDEYEVSFTKLVEQEGRVCLVRSAEKNKFEIWRLIKEIKKWEKVLGPFMVREFGFKTAHQWSIIPHRRSLFFARVSFCGIEQLYLYKNGHLRRKFNWVRHGIFPFTPTLNYLAS